MPLRYIRTTIVEPSIDFNSEEEYTAFLDQFSQGKNYRMYVREMRQAGKLLTSFRRLDGPRCVKTTSVWTTGTDFLAFNSTDIANRYNGLVSSVLKWNNKVVEHRWIEYPL